MNAAILAMLMIGAASVESMESADATADVFVRSTLGSHEVWVGEPVLLTLSVVTARPIRRPTLIDRPSLSLFRVEYVDVDPEAESHEEEIDGRSYTVYPLLRTILVPDSPGAFEIDPYVLQLTVRVPDTGPFPFFTVDDTIERETEPLTLQARQLPTEGRPDGFNRAVGSFTMKAWLDRDETRVDDPLSLTVTIEGSGSLHLAEPPALALPDHVEARTPTFSSASRATKAGLVSSATWEWILVPRAPTDATIPAPEFHYFDPARELYGVAGTNSLPIRVREADSGLD